MFPYLLPMPLLLLLFYRILCGLVFSYSHTHVYVHRLHTAESIIASADKGTEQPARTN